MLCDLTVGADGIVELAEVHRSNQLLEPIECPEVQEECPDMQEE